MRAYKTNSEMPWRIMAYGNESTWPELNTPVWVLIEEDTCDPTLSPGILLVQREEIEHPTEPGTIRMQWRLLDFDPEEQEEILQSNWITVRAWRHMTDHAGTWDRHLAANPFPPKRS